ncbi:MAG: OmpH family outer membrane protein [Pseudomonadota bacterium]
MHRLPADAPASPPPGFEALGGIIAEFPLAQRPSPVVTLDQERVFTGSQFGRRVGSALAEASRSLAAENRRIEAELTAEERDLTERRPSLPIEEFRALAAAFDGRVVALRRAQDSKALALQRRDEAERQAFLRAALPILRELIDELGAVAILDTRAVLFAAQSIDVTNRAIARIDARIGAGEALSPPGPIIPEVPVLPAAPQSQEGDGMGLNLDGGASEVPTGEGAAPGSEGQ